MDAAESMDAPVRGSASVAPEAPPRTFGGRLTPLDATADDAIPPVETRWVPLVPATSDVEWSSRSGAFLMLATRADPPVGPGGTSPPLPAAVADAAPRELRPALVSCLEAILPELEPGWSHCTEHARCRAVQEATTALWGPGPGASASSGAQPEMAPAEVAGRRPTPPTPNETGPLAGGAAELMSPETPSQAGP